MSEVKKVTKVECNTIQKLCNKLISENSEYSKLLRSITVGGSFEDDTYLSIHLHTTYDGINKKVYLRDVGDSKTMTKVLSDIKSIIKDVTGGVESVDPENLDLELNSDTLTISTGIYTTD